MDSFTIKGNGGFITVTLDEVFGFPDDTSDFGGYESSAIVEISSGCFYCKADFYISTGDLFNFYQELKSCNQKLTGIAKLISYEVNLELTVEYGIGGHVNIKGFFSEPLSYNEMQFEVTTDQTFIASTINELEAIADKYGDMKGIRK